MLPLVGLLRYPLYAPSFRLECDGTVQSRCSAQIFLALLGHSTGMASFLDGDRRVGSHVPELQDAEPFPRLLTCHLHKAASFSAVEPRSGWAQSSPHPPSSPGRLISSSNHFLLTLAMTQAL